MNTPRSLMFCTLAMTAVSGRTLAQPVPVRDISPGASHSNPVELADGHGTLFFQPFESGIGPRTWKSDGTAAGTVRFTPVIQGKEFTQVGDTILFAGVTQFGVELYRTDGTDAGTVLVKDIRPGNPGSDPQELTAVGDRLFFTADDGNTGRELWTSDGTAAGTVLVKDIRSGSTGSGPVELTELCGALYFVADDGLISRELWTSDGTANGTAPVADIRGGSSAPARLTPHEQLGLLFFVARSNQVDEVFRTDGTAQGTFPLVQIPGFANIATIDDFAVFSGRASTSEGTELFRSDGTVAGTTLVVDIFPGFRSSLPQHLTRVGGIAYFTADDGTSGRELWKTDGTPAGTVQVADLRPGSTGSSIHGLAAAGTRHVAFAADDGMNGEELGVSDGTAAGTVIHDIHSGAGSSRPMDFTLVGGNLFFTADDGQIGRELWKLFPGATARRLAQGCSASSACPPSLRMTDPVLGATSRITGARAPNGAGTLIVGLPVDLPLRLPIGAGCFLCVNPAVMVGVPITPGSGWFFDLPIPNGPFSGVVLALQAGFADASGLSVSNCVHGTLGN